MDKYYGIRVRINNHMDEFFNYTTLDIAQHVVNQITEAMTNQSTSIKITSNYGDGFMPIHVFRGKDITSVTMFEQAKINN